MNATKDFSASLLTSGHIWGGLNEQVDQCHSCQRLGSLSNSTHTPYPLRPNGLALQRRSKGEHRSMLQIFQVQLEQCAYQYASYMPQYSLSASAMSEFIWYGCHFSLLCSLSAILVDSRKLIVWDMMSQLSGASMIKGKTYVQNLGSTILPSPRCNINMTTPWQVQLALCAELALDR